MYKLMALLTIAGLLGLMACCAPDRAISVAMGVPAARAEEIDTTDDAEAMEEEPEEGEVEEPEEEPEAEATEEPDEEPTFEPTGVPTDPYSAYDENSYVYDTYAGDDYDDYAWKDDVSLDDDPYDGASYDIDTDSGEVDDWVDEETGAVISWESSTAEELVEDYGYRFNVPEGAKYVSYRVAAEAQMGELRFELDDVELVARVRSGKSEDLFGLDADSWDAVESCRINGFKGTLSRARDEEGDMELCRWYDGRKGVNCALTAEADQLDGFDLVDVAEQMFGRQAE